MKMNLARVLFSLLSLAIIGTSCDPNEPRSAQQGTLSLAISPENANRSGRSQATDYYAVVVSIEDTKGNPVETDRTLQLLQFGDGFTTDALQLNPGSYRITKFLIIDQANSVVLATPREGSMLAEFVSDPLPIDFEISSNNVTSVVPEVIPVTANQTPSDFGYVNFGFKIVTPPTAPVDLKIKFVSPVNGISIDSAIIIFTSNGSEVKHELDIHESTSVPGVMLATGLVNNLQPATWQIKIAFYTTLIPNKQSKIYEGVFDFAIKATSGSLLSSGDSKLAILGDVIESPSHTQVIHWEEYFDFFLPDNLNSRVRLPVDPLNPFFEVSIPNPDWGYFYIDRIFYDTPASEPVGGFVRGSVSVEDYRREGSLTYDLIDSLSFKTTTTAVSATSWNTADCVFMVLTNDGKETPLFYYLWDSRTSQSGRKAVTIPNTMQSKNRMLGFRNK